MDLLRTISDCVMHDSEWENRRIRKSRTTAIAAAVSEENKKKMGKRFTKAADIKTQNVKIPGHNKKNTL